MRAAEFAAFLGEVNAGVLQSCKEPSNQGPSFVRFSRGAGHSRVSAPM
jgi:hypothetical protein